ncbi:MAG TPA: SMR family transporter [Marinobacter sp.]|nr:SMR family transporter [Marinobacter sp.]
MPDPLPATIHRIAQDCIGIAYEKLLKSIPVRIAYAIWAGLGIVLISVVGWLFFDQQLDGPGIAGMTLIIAGVLVIQVFSRSSVH